MIVNVADGDAGVFLRGLPDALDAFLKVGRVLVAGQNGHHALAPHQLRQLLHHLLAAFNVVDGIGDKPFAVGRVGIERGHRDAVLDG